MSFQYTGGQPVAAASSLASAPVDSGFAQIAGALNQHVSGAAYPHVVVAASGGVTVGAAVQGTTAAATAPTDLWTMLDRLANAMGVAVAGTGAGAGAWATQLSGVGASGGVAQAASANTPSTLVRRDASGNIAVGIVTGALVGNASTATNVAASGITGTIAAAQIDTAIARTANVPTNAGTGATGTWPINVTGNAATATSVLASGISGTIAGTQIDGTIARTANVPTNTGTGASGTWPINVTGNAATATSATSATTATSAGTATDLAAGSVLGVGKGGTGRATLTANALLVGAGTSVPTSLSPGVAGTVLVSDGTTWGPGVVQVPDYSLTTKKLLDGAVTPYAQPSLRVWVSAMKKFDQAGNPVEWTGGDLDLSSYVPGSGTSVWVLIYLNNTASLYAAAGQPSATPQKPQTIGGQTPLAYILMYAGQTQIVPADIYEWRTDFAAFAVGGGTGSGYSPVGHLHGQGGESFIAIAATDEGRVTTPSVAGMTVYVQPMRYTDTSGAVQQFGGGPSATIARPVSNPYLAAIGLSQTGSVTINYGAEATTPARGTFLNTTDAPLAYILVRPASTRTVLNDDGVNAVIIDARRSFTYASPAASGVSGVATGGTGQSSFATAGIVISPGGTSPLTTIPGAASATVGMAVTPTVTPAGLDADGFQIGAVNIATTGTNITNFRSMHLMPPTKTGTGTVANMYGTYVDGPTIAGTTSTIANYVKTGTTGSVGMVVDTVAAPTGNIQEWRANGTVVAAVGPAGQLGIGSGINSLVQVFLGGTYSPPTSSSVYGIAQNTILKPTAAGGAVIFNALANTGTVDTSAAGGAVTSAYGVLVGAVGRTGANTIAQAFGVYITIPTAAAANVGLAFNTPAGAIAQEAWTAPTLLNSWVNIGSGNQTASFFKDTQGLIHTRGIITGGAGNTNFWVYPTGYRTASGIDTFAVVSSSGTPGVATVNMNNSGGIYLSTGASGTVWLGNMTHDTR